MFRSFLVTTLTHSYKIISTVGGGGFEKQKSHPTELCQNPLRGREEMLPFMTNTWPCSLRSSSLRNTVEYRNIMGGKHSGSKHPFSIPVSPELKTHQTQWRYSLSQVIPWALSPLLKGQSWAIWKKTLLYSLFSHLNLTHLPSAKAHWESSLFHTQFTRNLLNLRICRQLRLQNNSFSGTP